MVFLFLVGLILSPIMTWAIESNSVVYGTLWAITVFSLLMVLTDNNIGLIMKLVFSVTVGGGCMGTIIFVILLGIGTLFWGLNIDSLSWYVALPVYTVAALIGGTMLYAQLDKDEREEQARKQAQQDLSDIKQRLTGETREERIRRILDTVEKERREDK